MANTFAQRFGNNQTRIQQGLAVFDDPKIVKYVADPRLRAAIAILKGTAGEAAIAAIRNGNFARVIFGPLETGGSANAIAVSRLVPGDPRQTIIFNERYRYEDVRLLAEVMAHEVLHVGNLVSNKEELIANTVDALVYAQLLLEDPGIARSGTELARRLNTKLMALINSRDASGRIRILTSSTTNVYPGSSGPPLPYFAAAFLPFGADTPGNATLAAELSAVTRMNITAANFDDRTVRLLDQNINLLTPSQWVRLAGILRLATGVCTSGVQY
ncbi:MAG: hypothetical protein ABWY02_04990 [Telluria sp.]